MFPKRMNKMNKTRVLFILLPPSNQQNEQDEQNPGFSPLPSNPPKKGGEGVNLNLNKTNKMNKTRVSALSPLNPPPQKGGEGVNLNPQPPKKGGEVMGSIKTPHPPKNAQSLYMLRVNNSTLWDLLSMSGA